MSVKYPFFVFLIVSSLELPSHLLHVSNKDAEIPFPRSVVDDVFKEFILIFFGFHLF